MYVLQCYKMAILNIIGLQIIYISRGAFKNQSNIYDGAFLQK